ncbi:MAG TPA: hypothetical protein VMJ32_17470 [Pirellulales bacterium]|nr:hypothetical protein [Pirellulales bacterium]
MRALINTAEFNQPTDFNLQAKSASAGAKLSSPAARHEIRPPKPLPIPQPTPQALTDPASPAFGRPSLN